MLEMKIAQLIVGDEYTSDQGDTWWKVISNVATDGGHIRCVSASCVASQVPGLAVGTIETGTYAADEIVVTR